MADHQPADLLRERLDPLLQRIALIGEGELGAVRVRGLGDAPGDRAVVGDAHDQAALAAHETGVRHASLGAARCWAPTGLVWHRALGQQAAGRGRNSRPEVGDQEYCAAGGVCESGMCGVARVVHAAIRARSEGSLSGFRQDVQATIPALRRYARALTRDAEAADDLVQDTLVRALRSEHLFHGGDIRSWLYTILTNLNRNRLRSLARRPTLTPIEENDAPDAPGRRPADAISSVRSPRWSTISASRCCSWCWKD